MINTGYQYQYHNSWPSFHAAATFVCIFEIEVYQCDSCWCGWLLLTIINFLYIFNLWIFKGCLFFFNRKSLDIDYRRWHLSLEVNICMTYYIYRYMNIDNNKGIYCVLCYDNLLILFFLINLLIMKNILMNHTIFQLVYRTVYIKICIGLNKYVLTDRTSS